MLVLLIEIFLEFEERIDIFVDILAELLLMTVIKLYIDVELLFVEPFPVF